MTCESMRTKLLALLVLLVLAARASGFASASIALSRIARRTEQTRLLWSPTGVSHGQPIIAPSILSADFTRLGEEVSNVASAGADAIHFDVMDSHFVPNLSFGPMVCRALRDMPLGLDIDVHLMVQNPERMIEAFAQAGASYITIHPESCRDTLQALMEIKRRGLRAGIAIVPGGSPEAYRSLLHMLDTLLVMSVRPGFGSQAFLPSSLQTVQAARKMIDESGRDIRLQIDGGINEATVKSAYDAGADFFVAGSAIFRPPRTLASYSQVIQALRQKISPT